MRSSLLLLALTGCAAKSPDAVSIPVVQDVHVEQSVRVVETVKHCVTRGQIPDEPPLIAEKLTGQTKFDIGPLAESARQLRTALQRARALLVECAK